MPHYLLLGAGFSRNWGGWLATETFEYLLGSPLVDDDIRALLWTQRRQDGFEGALGTLQDEYFRSESAAAKLRLNKLEDALIKMFNDMREGFANVPFEFHSSSGKWLQDTRYQVRTFLLRFDVIFTLNQDLLLEQHYLLRQEPWGRWNGFQIPGCGTLTGGRDATSPLTPTSNDLQLPSDRQPYIKLHGSSNWKGGDGRDMLVMGANKPSIIDRFPVIKWNHEQFRSLLLKPTARLMVIGYGFGDAHINRVIQQATSEGDLRVFIVDPLGLDLIDENRNLHIYAPGPLLTSIGPRVTGASRRSLREIFGFDSVEHAKLMRFFS